jgi:hypothetical protein
VELAGGGVDLVDGRVGVLNGRGELSRPTVEGGDPALAQFGDAFA